VKHHTTNETSTTAIEAPTPEMLAYIASHPNWDLEPVVDLMRAGFSSQEFGVFAALSLAAHHAALPETLESPAAMRDAAEKLLIAADCRELDQAMESGRRVVDVAFPDGKLGDAFHLVHQKMAGSAHSRTINIPVDGPWASEIARATPGSTFGSAECTFTYIGLFDYLREWYDEDARHLGRFVERLALDEAARVSL
jgi:hypothetical protein